MDFCQHCGTCPNNGERKCETPEQVRQCLWMNGVHRHAIIMPTSEDPEIVTPE